MTAAAMRYALIEACGWTARVAASQLGVPRKGWQPNSPRVVVGWFCGCVARRANNGPDNCGGQVIGPAILPRHASGPRVRLWVSSASRAEVGDRSARCAVGRLGCSSRGQ